MVARITAKEYIAARQIKRRLYFRGQPRRCSLRLCYGFDPKKFNKLLGDTPTFTKNMSVVK